MARKQGQTTFSCRLFFALALGLAGCASQPEPPSPEPRQPYNSLLPGTIGVVVRNSPEGPVVAGVRKSVEGVREGDIVLRFNGAPVRTAREFNRYVADSRPGSTAELELSRDGVVRRVGLSVRQLDVMPRG